MPTFTVDEPTAAALRRFPAGVELLDGRGSPLGKFVPAACDTEPESRREWVAKMAAEFPPDVLDRIESEPSVRTMAEVLALAEEPA